MPDDNAPPILEDESFTPPSGKGGGSPPASAPPVTGTFAGTDDEDHTDCPGVAAWIDEAQRLRTELLAAQTRASELEASSANLAQELSQSREALDHAERRHQIDLALIETGAIDLESARLLTELAVQQMPGKDVRAVIDDLRKHKPQLFRPRPAASHIDAARGAPGPMSAAASHHPPHLAEDAAEEAALTGDRNALLRYLRARRGG